MYIAHVDSEKFLARYEYLIKNEFLSQNTKDVLQPLVQLLISGTPWKDVSDTIGNHLQGLLNTSPDQHAILISELSSLRSGEPLYGEKVDVRIYGEADWQTGGICVKPRKLWVEIEDVTTWGENEIEEWRPSVPPVRLNLDPNNPHKLL